MAIPLKISYCLAFIAFCACIGVSLSAEKCASTSIGLANKVKFPESSFEASYSFHCTPEDVRMDSENLAWMPSFHSNTDNDMIQINLKKFYKICSIGLKGGYIPLAKQGGVGMKGFVKTYEFKYRHYNNEWRSMSTLQGSKSYFDESKHVFEYPIITDAVRFIPKEFKGHPLMQVELYGFIAFSKTTEYGKRPSGTCILPLGLENNGIINDQIAASSEENSKEKTWKNSARLNCIYSWRAGKNVKGEYIQVDLGQIMHVTGIAVQGDHCGYRWVKSFKLQHSTDGKKFHGYQKFKGTKVISEIATSWFSHPINARYIRVVVEEWHGGISMRMELYGCQQTCDNQPIGLENGVITDSELSASSTLNDNTPANHARLNFDTGESWCASLTDNNAYLQIDLKSPHVLCAITTQGNSKNDQMVTSYTIQTSMDGKLWTDYKVKDKISIFEGNSISSVIAKNFFDAAPASRYVRLLPKSYFGAPCIRLELYGVQKWGCDRAAAGVGEIRTSSNVIPNYRMTATSEFNKDYTPDHGRLNHVFGWQPKTNNNPRDYLQIDIGDPMILCAVGLQGTGQSWRLDERTLFYKLSVSMDGKTWKDHPQELPGVTKLVPVAQTGVIARNAFSQPHTFKFIRIYPTKSYQYKTVRMELYGLRQGWKESIGLEKVIGKPTFHNRDMSSSSSKGAKHTAESVRLYSKNSWCTTKTNNAYIQFDLGAVKQLLGIAMQGDGAAAEWVTEYKLGYGFTLDEMSEIKNIPTGLHNNRDVKIHWLPSPLGARHVRISPTKWYTKGDPCIRTELYVNDRAPTAYITQSHVHGNLTATPGSHVTVTCSASGDKAVAIKWFLSGHDVTDKSAGSTYSKRLTTSKLRVNFTSVLEVRSMWKCISVDKLKVMCSTTVDCASERSNANGDRKTHVVQAIVDLPPPTNHPSTSTPKPTPSPTAKPTQQAPITKRKHSKPMPPVQPYKPLSELIFNSAADSVTGTWVLVTSITLCILGDLLILSG